jgi:hypothetical protein
VQGRTFDGSCLGIDVANTIPAPDTATIGRTGQSTARGISPVLDARKVWEFDSCSSDRDRAMLDEPGTPMRREEPMKTAKHTTAPLTTEKLAAILERFAAAQTVVDFGIAAGIALNELRGVDD